MNSSNVILDGASCEQQKTPLWKLAAAGSLAVVFAVVRVLPNGQDAATNGAASSTTTGIAPSAIGGRIDARRTAASRWRQTQFSDDVASRLVASNPFSANNAGDSSNRADGLGPRRLSPDQHDAKSRRLPASNTAENADAMTNRVATNLAVEAIVMGRGGPAALVGGRIVYVDDTIENRWRVVEIRADGLVVAPIETAATSPAEL